MRWMAVGLQAVYAFPLGILLCGYLGNWMDQRWNGHGRYAMAGIFIGLVAGMVNLIQVSRQFLKNEGGPPETPAGGTGD